MCGIAGYLSFEAPPQRGLLEAMADRLAHRGPDDAGYFQDAHAALAHRRLSIIDLSGGGQPMGNEDGSLQVVFNGEIYNYLEHRQELIRRGHRLETQSDTEVLVHLYEEMGERLPEHLNGMFAFGIWDSRRQELFLARDRLGKKPLYYTGPAGSIDFAFASELKALTALPGFRNTASPESVAGFLGFGYVPEPQSIFAGVWKLPPGSTLVVSRSGIRLRRYWRPRFEDSAVSFGEGVEEIRALAADAVKRRMISDVPLGAFLSGGVDSSAVVGLMAGLAPERVKTFSIGFLSKGYDELPYARQVAHRWRTEHHEQVITPRIEEMLDKLVEHFDEPFADSSAIPMLYLARMTRQHVTVALCGDGADEIFGGYRLYAYGMVESRLREMLPDSFRRSVVRAAGEYYPKFDYLPRVFRARSLLRNVSRQMAEAHFLSRSIFTSSELARLLSPALRETAREPEESMHRQFDQVTHLPPLQQMQAVDLETYLPGDILVKADRATMAYSLESRSPFLDYRLAELGGRLPAKLKVRRLTGKYIFKKAMAPHVSSDLLRRAKMGFSVPMAQWMRGSLKPIFDSVAMRPEMEEYVQLHEVQKLWREHQSGLSDHSRKLWALLMLAAWDGRWRKSNRTRTGSARPVPLLR